ncbi:MAG: N-acetylmannosamine-6-phosphate 2-epimerase [Vulcanimicrobiaceae bacterium]
MKPVLERLRGGLIVSIQPPAASVLASPTTVALLARCAAANGAVGVRIEGIANVAAVRAAIVLPVVGLVKRASDGFETYITPSLADVAGLIAAGADAIAFDATDRPRSGGAEAGELLAAIRAGGTLAFADCARIEDGVRAAKAGAEIVATTLAGYTSETRGRIVPDYDLLERLAAHHSFAVCEGGIGLPADLRAAFSHGASAVVVGRALSDLDANVARFAAAAKCPVWERRG